MKAEDHVDFDIWGKIKEGKLKDAINWTANIHSISISDALQSVRFASSKNGYIQIFLRCGWNDISEHLQKLPDFVLHDSYAITESSFEPFACSYCEKHNLWHAKAPCPVCSGLYISHVIDGQGFCARKNSQ